MTQPKSKPPRSNELEKLVEDAEKFDKQWRKSGQHVGDNRTELYRKMAFFAAQVEERERERCCKDVCDYCRGRSDDYKPAELILDAWRHRHKNEAFASESCQAATIRQRGERSVTRG